MKFYRMRGGSGFGDALYLRPIVMHIAAAGKLGLEIATDFPSIFKDIQNVRTAERSKENIQIIAHYMNRKHVQGTSQFEDMCIYASKNPYLREAGIDPMKVAYDLKWKVRNPGLVEEVLEKAGTKPVLFVPLPRLPMNRRDGFGDELSPVWRVCQHVVDDVGGRFFKVMMGKGAPLYHMKGVDLDLSNKTSYTDVIDVATVCSAFLGFGSSFVIPLAESLMRPALHIWSARGLRSKNPFLTKLTPQKVLHAGRSGWVIDEWPIQKVQDRAKAYLKEKVP